MHIVELDHVKKSFDGTEVLKDISLYVDKGEVVSIIGPSGSGKSTLLRCATLLETMDDGSLSYAGERIADSKNGRSVYASKEILKKARSCFGLVFQNFELFPHFTVLRNITDPPVRNQGRDRGEAEREAMALLEKVGLSDKRDAYPCELSGGQKQRVAIARALAMKPDILYFDEPTSALDPELTQEILKVIRTLAEEKMTMVIVTHEMKFAREVSDRIIFMEKGTIVENDSPDKVFSSTNERTRQFIGKF